MPSAAGLSATYGGYQKARKADNEIQSGDIANQQAQTGLEADTAWGNTIPVLQQMLQPGASPMPPGGGAPPGGPAPQAPPPGQSSQPMHAPAPPQAGPQPQMLGGPAPPTDPTMSVAPGQQNAAPPGSVGERFGGLPGGGGNPGSTPLPPPPVSAAPPPSQPAQLPMQPQGPQAQQSQQAGRLDLHTIMAAVVKANPGAKPAVIAAAVAKALPLMTAQSQMDYKNLMIQLGNTRAQETATHHAATEDLAGQKIDATRDIAGAKINSNETIAGNRITSNENIAAGKNDTTLQRTEMNNRARMAVATLSTEARKEIEAAKQAGAVERAELSANTRMELGKLSAATRMEVVGWLEEGKDRRALSKEQNTNARFQEGQARTDERLDKTLGSREKVATDKNTAAGERQAAGIASREGIAGLRADTQTEIAKLSAAARADITRELESGRNGRAGLQADTRTELAKLGWAARQEIIGKLEAGRNSRTADTLQSRGAIAADKEAGLESRQADRNLFATQRLKLQSDNLERQIKKDGTLEDNARNRQTLKLMEDDNNAEFKRAQQKIAAQNVFAPNKSKEKLTQDAETAYQNAKQRIEQYRTSMGGKGAASEGGDQPPPEAVKSLKEGHVTTFGNGQKWTLQGGKPVRVP